MTVDSQPSAANSPRYRHPATVLLLCLFTASELFLNLWYVEPPSGDDVYVLFGNVSPSEPEHGYPLTWVDRDFRFRPEYLDEPRGERLRLEQKLQTALPWDLLVGDTDGVSFSFLMLALDAAIGIILFSSLRLLGDRYFGFRAIPAHRFGLRTLMLGMIAPAVLFAFSSESALQTAARSVFVVSVVVLPWSVVVLTVAARRANQRQRLELRAPEDLPRQENELADLSASER